MSRITLVNLLDDFTLGGVTKGLAIFDSAPVRAVADCSTLPINSEAMIAPALDADIIVTHFPPNWRRLAFLALLRARNPKATLIHVEHSYSGDWEDQHVPHRARFRLMMKWALAMVDHVVCVSNRQAQWLMEGDMVEPHRLDVIYPSSQTKGLDALPLPEFESARPLVVGAYGRFAPAKGFDRLIAAFKRLNPEDRLELLLGGFGPDEEALKAQAAGCSRIRFAGQISDLPAYLAQCDVIAVPSRFEAYGQVANEAREAGRYDRAMQQYEVAAVKTGQSRSFLNGGQAFLITSGLVIVMSMAALGVQRGELTVGDFVMVNAYMIQITMPLNFLGTVYREIRQALVDMGQMFGLLGQPAEVQDKPGAPELKVSGGEIVFDDVRFSYEPSREILKGVSFTVKPGQRLALVGHSGSGKSTIGRLLFRFYDVSGGSIRIDGQDLRDVAQTSLHAQIGVVPQDTVLFNDTIRYNIAYGKDNASEAEIVAAAKAARIHDFILSLPEGYETKVGERGLKLSGGEKQRVGIARTLLKNPPILILDEATSALDTQTEQSIQESLSEMGQGRSVIVIAHRLSTIADADQILVMEEGLVVERGTHESLLEAGGLFAAMWARQIAEDDGQDAVAAE